MSFVVRQHVIGKAGFLEKHPGAWLIWEPGEWSRPANTGHTVASSTAYRPAPGDALCFHLGVKPGRLKVGRGQGNMISLNEATVSRTHFELELNDARWTAVVFGDKVLLLDERRLTAGTPAVLVSGASLKLGQVALTFLDPQGFLLRVRDKAG
jgi:hypothetical protein